MTPIALGINIGRRLGHSGPSLSLTTPALAPLAVWELGEGSGNTAFLRGGSTVPNDNIIGAPERMFATGADVSGYSGHVVTLTDDVANNRDGIPIASRLVAADTNGYFSKDIVLAAGTYTLSIDVKSNTGSPQNFRMSGDGGGSNSGTLVATTTWTRFSYTFVSAGGTATLLPIWQTGGAALDLLMYGAKLNVGAAATPYVRPNWELELGKTGGSTDSSRPGWISSGLAMQGSKFGIALGGADVVTSQASLYAVARWTGTPVAAGYGPLLSESYAGGDAHKVFLQVNDDGVWGEFSTLGGVSAINAPTVKIGSGWHVFAMTYDGAALRLFVDDVEVKIARAAGLSAVTLREIFLGTLNAGWFWPGDIGVAAVYTAGHSLAQVASVGGLMRTIMATRSVAMLPCVKLVAFEGDSISHYAAGGTYPATVIRTSTAGAQGNLFAAAGSTIANLNTRAADVDAVYDATRSRNVLHVLIGRNDITVYANAATWTADFKTYCLARKAAGWKVAVATVLPSTASGYNTLRNAINTLIRADTSFYDALVDFAADATMGPDAAASDTTYYSDGTHPTTAGQAILAPLAQTVIDQLLNTTQIVLSPSTLALPAGTTSTVTGTAKDVANASTGAPVVYASSDTGVATVDSSGLVTWVSAGTATITASYAGITSNVCTVTAAVAGPTVQLAGVTSPLSLVHGTTGTFTATPEDINAAPTGAVPQWHSSDESVVRIDDATTGAYTVTGSATDTVTITVNFVAPASFAAPSYNAGTDTLLWYNEFNYPDLATFDAAYSRAGTYLAPNTVSSEQGIVDSDRPGKTVTERAYQNNYNGINTDAPKMVAMIAVGDRPVAAATRYHEFWTKLVFPLDHIPWSVSPLRVKFFEESHGSSRNQWSIVTSGANAGSDVTSSIWEDFGQAYATPPTLSDQQRGPYPGELIRTGEWFKVQRACRTHTAASGTVDVIVETCEVHLRSGTPPTVGARMTLRNNVGVAINQAFGASYEVMSVTAGTDDFGACTIIVLQRRYDAVATTDYGYDPSLGFCLATYRAVFSADQTGLLFVGDYLATFNASTMGGFSVTSIIDGTNALLARNSSDHENTSQVEMGGATFARSRDGFTGFSRTWINGILVYNQCRASIGDPTVPGTMKQLAQFAVAQTLQLVYYGDNQTSGPGIGDSNPVTPWSQYLTQVRSWTRIEP